MTLSELHLYVSQMLWLGLISQHHYISAPYDLPSRVILACPNYLNLILGHLYFWLAFLLSSLFPEKWLGSVFQVVVLHKLKCRREANSIALLENDFQCVAEINQHPIVIRVVSCSPAWYGKALCYSVHILQDLCRIQPFKLNEGLQYMFSSMSLINILIP